MADLQPYSDSRSERLRELAAFTLRSERGADGTHTIFPAGELDIATAPDVEAELLRVEATDARSIVLDLSALRFIDSTGIRLVVVAQRRSRADANRLSLRRPSERVFGVFARCGMAEHLLFAD